MRLEVSYTQFIKFFVFLLLITALFLRGAKAEFYWYPVELGIFIVTALWLLGIIYEFVPRPIITGVEFPLLAFFGWRIISALVSNHRWNSIDEIFRNIALLFFFFIVFQNFTRTEDIKILLYGLYFLCIAEALWGLSSYFGGGLEPFGFLPSNRSLVRGTFVNHNSFAALMNLGFFLGLGLIMEGSEVRESRSGEHLGKLIVLSIPLPILVVALILSLSRGGWISFIFGIVAYGFFLWQRLDSKRVRSYIGAGAINLLIVGIILGYVEKGPILERLLEIDESLSQQKTEMKWLGRVSIWRSSLRMMASNYLFGAGPGAYWLEYPSYREAGMWFSVKHAHNDFLELGGECGVIGLILGIWLCTEGFWRGIIYASTRRRRAQDLCYCLLIGAGCFILHSFVDFPFQIPALLMVFLSISAVLLNPLWAQK